MTQDPSSRPSPVRSRLHRAPEEVPDLLWRALASAPQSGQDRAEAPVLGSDSLERAVRQVEDEPFLLAALASAHGKRLVTRPGFLSGILERARDRQEAWNPVLDALAAEDGISLWSRAAAAQKPGAGPPLPTPQAWATDQAGAWVSATPSEVVLDALQGAVLPPWRDLLATAASPVSARLCRILIGDPDALRALVRRPGLTLAEADLLLDTLARQLEARRPGPRPSRAVQPADPRALASPTLPAVLGRLAVADVPLLAWTAGHVSQRFGQLPPGFQAALAQACAPPYAPDPNAPPGVRLVLAADPTATPDQVAGLLDAQLSPTHLALAGMHAAFLDVHGRAWLQALDQGRSRYDAPGLRALQALLFPDSELVPPFAPTAFLHLIARLQDGLRTPGTHDRIASLGYLAQVVRHPGLPHDALALVVNGPLGDQDVLRAAMVAAPGGWEVPEVRTMYDRVRAGTLLPVLLASAPAEAIPSLWRRLLKANPAEALRLVETDTLRHAWRPTRADLAPALARAPREIRLRGLALLPSLRPGVDTMGRRTTPDPASSCRAHL